MYSIVYFSCHRWGRQALPGSRATTETTSTPSSRLLLGNRQLCKFLILNINNNISIISDLRMLYKNQWRFLYQESLGSLWCYYNSVGQPAAVAGKSSFLLQLSNFQRLLYFKKCQRWFPWILIAGGIWADQAHRPRLWRVRFSNKTLQLQLLPN